MTWPEAAWLSFWIGMIAGGLVVSLLVALALIVTRRS